jgi:hypothetical protein
MQLMQIQPESLTVWWSMVLLWVLTCSVRSQVCVTAQLFNYATDIGTKEARFHLATKTEATHCWISSWWTWLPLAWSTVNLGLLYLALLLLLLLASDVRRCVAGVCGYYPVVFIMKTLSWLA